MIIDKINKTRHTLKEILKDEWDISAWVIKRIGKNLTTHKA